MVDAKQYSVAWKSLMSSLQSIVDPILRNSIKAEFIKRAIAEWGFNPETGKVNVINETKLDDWEKEFLRDIENTRKYQMDIRKEKRKQEELELRKNMYFFIKGGGSIVDIPMEICRNYITDVYLQELKKVYQVE